MSGRKDAQTQIDFARAEQLAILRQATLPTVKIKSNLGGSVSPMVLKSVLRLIDDHAGRNGEAYLRYPTLAREVGCSLNTAKRAIEALQLLSLITVELKPPSTRKRPCNHYRVVWNELALLSPAHATKGKPCVERLAVQSTNASGKSTTPDVESTTVDAKSTTVERATGSAQGNELPPTPVELAEEWRKVERAARGRGCLGFRKAVAAARAAGCTPEDAIWAMAHVRTQRGSDDIGRLIFDALLDADPAEIARGREAAHPPESQPTPTEQLTHAAREPHVEPFIPTRTPAKLPDEAELNLLKQRALAALASAAKQEPTS